MGLYLHRNRWLLDLPMRAARHDAVNGWSENVGRAGSELNAVFGAGVAEPTKLDYRRGYYFDGGDYMWPSSPDVYQITSGLVSVMITFGGLNSGVAEILFGWEDVPGGTLVATLYNTGTAWRFITGNFGAPNSASATWANYSLDIGLVCTSVGVHDGTNTLLYINGEYAAAAGTPLAPSAAAEPMIIGARGNQNNKYTGNIYHVGMADFALGPNAVAQYHREMMKRYHQR